MKKPASDCPVENLKNAIADALLDDLARLLRAPAHTAVFRRRLLILGIVVEVMLIATLIVAVVTDS